MEIRTSVEKSDRKKLVEAISKITGASVEYRGAPTFAYEVGGFTVDREGAIFFGPSTKREVVESVVNQLAKQGFGIITGDRLTIEIPIEGFTEQALENLNKLIASKATLIKKVTGADNLLVRRTESTLEFPWFSLGTSDETRAYSQLIEGLCRVAKKRNRITAKERPVENEKFAFRVFLLQLGFVGDDYKMARKIFMRNLTGNTAFKNGTPTKVGERG